MTPEVLAAIRDAYPTARLGHPSGVALARYGDLALANQVLTAIRQITGIECEEEWAPEEALDRALRLFVVSPSRAVWWREFHGRPTEKRAATIRNHQGLLCNLTVYISNLSPFWARSWTCFNLGAAGDVVDRYSSEPPTPFWAGVASEIESIFAKHQRGRLTEEQLRERIDWIDPDRAPNESYPEEVTVYSCLFDYLG